MVVTENVCGGAAKERCSGASSLTPASLAAASPFKDVGEDLKQAAQSQLRTDTLISLKERLQRAFADTSAGWPHDATRSPSSGEHDPFKEVMSDGGLFGASCNYAVGLHGVQGRQRKCEDYTFHLALGPQLFAPFDDTSRAFLACVLDGHGGVGAVQYVAERFPALLLEDLPRLRSSPGTAMRAALHVIDEELLAAGHNSGTTVNALLVVDDLATVINTGDCRCILYDYIEEKAVQITNDHNLLCVRERQRVVGAGAELSDCGGYVVLPCPTDGSKLLGVTKALGHAGVKSFQRSSTLTSLLGINELGSVGFSGTLEEENESGSEAEAGEGEAGERRGGSAELPRRPAPVGMSGAGSPYCKAAGAGGSGRRATAVSPSPGSGRPPRSPGLPGPSASSFSSSCSNGGSSSRGPVAGAEAHENGKACPGAEADNEPVPAGRGVISACGMINGSPPGAGVNGYSPSHSHGHANGQANREANGHQLHCNGHVSSNGHAIGHCAACPVNVDVQGQRRGEALSLPRPRDSSGGGSANGSSGQHARSSSCPDGSVAQNGTGSSFSTAAGAAHAAAATSSSPSAAANGSAVAPALTSSLLSVDLAPTGPAGCAAAATSSPSPAPPACPSNASVASNGGFVLECDPDVFTFEVRDDRHLVLLGCDGVFDKMTNVEACKTAVRSLTASTSCADAAREVTHRAVRLGSSDNVTVCIARFGRKPIMRKQSLSVLSLRRSSSNTSGDLAASGGSMSLLAGVATSSLLGASSSPSPGGGGSVLSAAAAATTSHLAPTSGDGAAGALRP